eukprot:CAMPEP_0118968518 /NCGR_PEP_ID=MMETSP1173-20130426/5737_1 /TAXON_ID=1034831 /ORGANISM="Rhizochromulina marina cf, Strain CCMP1243" /LENGTH=271 /DNA_ID=CAMNT_0006917645 /DNA_START=61 /DNA_END=873 /DNA_ORIENTATION=-
MHWLLGTLLWVASVALVPAVLTFFTYVAVEGAAQPLLVAVARRLLYALAGVEVLASFAVTVPRLFLRRFRRQVLLVLSSRVHLGLLALAAATVMFAGTWPPVSLPVLLAYPLCFLLAGVALVLLSDVEELLDLLELVLRDVNLMTSLMSTASAAAVVLLIYLSLNTAAVVVSLVLVAGLLVCCLFDAARLVGCLGIFAFSRDEVSSYSVLMWAVLFVLFSFVAVASLGVVPPRPLDRSSFFDPHHRSFAVPSEGSASPGSMEAAAVSHMMM